MKEEILDWLFIICLIILIPFFIGLKMAEFLIDGVIKIGTGGKNAYND